MGKQEKMQSVEPIVNRQLKATLEPKQSERMNRAELDRNLTNKELYDKKLRETLNTQKALMEENKSAKRNSPVLGTGELKNQSKTASKESGRKIKAEAVPKPSDKILNKSKPVVASLRQKSSEKMVETANRSKAVKGMIDPVKGRQTNIDSKRTGRMNKAESEPRLANKKPVARKMKESVTKKDSLKMSAPIKGNRSTSEMKKEKLVGKAGLDSKQADEAEKSGLQKKLAESKLSDKKLKENLSESRASMKMPESSSRIKSDMGMNKVSKEHRAERQQKKSDRMTKAELEPKVSKNILMERKMKEPKREQKVSMEMKDSTKKKSHKKSEAMINFNGLNKYYKKFIRESNNKIADAKYQLDMLQGKIDSLQKQFNFGKAITAETYNTQKKKFARAIKDIESSIKKNPTFIKSYTLPIDSLESIKGKLHDLSVKLEPKGKKLIKNIDKQKDNLENLFDSVQKKIKKRIDYDHRKDVFQHEMAIAYKHLKKAFVLS